MIGGTLIDLRPITNADISALYEIVSSPSVAPQWRNRGHLISIDDFARSLDLNVLCQMAVVVRGSDGGPVGLVAVYNQDTHSWHASLGMALHPSVRVGAIAADTITTFVQHAFETYPLNKLYLESVPAALDQYRSIVGSMVRQEGVLKDHQFFKGKYVDQHILAVHRSDWTRWRTEVSLPKAPAAQAGIREVLRDSVIGLPDDETTLVGEWLYDSLCWVLLLDEVGARYGRRAAEKLTTESISMESEYVKYLLEYIGDLGD